MFFSSHNTVRSYVTILTSRKFRYDKTDTNEQQENRNTKREKRPYDVTIFRECLFVVAVVVVVFFCFVLFLKRYMTFSFIIFVCCCCCCCFFFLSFLRYLCYIFPNMYTRVICKLVLNDILMSFFTL